MTGSIDAGNKFVSVTFGLSGAESITTLPFVICSFIFFSNAVSAMLEVAVTAGAGVLFVPLFGHQGEKKKLTNNQNEYMYVSIHTKVEILRQSFLFVISFFLYLSQCKWLLIFFTVH